jgi:TolB-like protein/Flp pilus assembly protein TadD
MMGRMAHLQAFVAELRRRRVIRALAVWGLLAFAALQVFEPVMHGLHLPEWTLSLVVVLLGLGFPFTAALAWVFDLKASGIERTPPAVTEEPASLAGSPPRRLRLALLLLGLGLAAAAPGLVYFFVWPGAGARPATAPSSADPGGPSIAVLPLVNLSSDREQEYFSDGLTEELLNLLSKVPGLRVAARTSTFAFKGRNVKMSEIGRELGVATVLEGSVRKSGDQIRITTQLVNASDGYHLWSETYDRKITDVFVVQDEIAAAVVGALKLKLLQAPGARAHRTESVEAHDLYLRGLYFWNLRTGESLLRAADFFRQAIQADPGYALAHAGLADAIEVRSGYAWTRGGPLRPQAKAAALRALELDPELGEAHASLGLMLADEFDWSGAVEHYRKAIALRPDYATARHWYAVTLASLGRAAEARREIEQALRLDPTSRIIGTNAGWVATMARDYARAERLYRAALDLAPDFEGARTELAMLYALQGRRAEALAEIEKVPTDGENRYVRAIVYARTGRRPEAERLAANLEELSAREYVPAMILALVWAALDDRDKAFAALRRVCQDREGSYGTAVATDPLFDGLRADPRLGEILDCLHLR